MLLCQYCLNIICPNKNKVNPTQVGDQMALPAQLVLADLERGAISGACIVARKHHHCRIITLPLSAHYFLSIYLLCI